MADHPVPSERARELVRGGFDPHVHVAPDFAPRRITDLQLAAALPRARARRLRAEVALHRDRGARRGRHARRCRASRALGTITLNHAVGGLNATAVEVAARQGARIVWLPTVSSENEFGEVEHADPDGKVPVWVRFELDLRAAGVRPQPVPVVDAEGAPLPELREVLDVIARHDIVLATGHLSRDEIFVVVDARRRRGREDDRGHPPRVPVAARQPRASSVSWPRKGALMERAFTTPYTGKCTWDDVFAATRAVGAEHTVWGTRPRAGLQPAGRGRAGHHGRPASSPPASARRRSGRWRSRTRGGWPVSRRVQVIGAHSADFVWRAGGAVAKAVELGGDGRGDRAVLRRARRVRRAVEAGGPDGRERQADPARARPRRRPGISARRSAASTSATTRCRSTPTRCCRSPTRSASSRPTC